MSLKKIPDSEQAYIKLKNITDALYSGERSEYSKDTIALLEDYGIKIRQDDGKLQSVNISIPQTFEDSIVVGLRYKKQDESYTEDHFLFQKNEGITAFYKGEFEKKAPEYDGTHKEQVQEREEDVSPEKAAWIYMSKDLARINVALESYDKIFENIEINNNAYNQIFQLILDSISARIVTGISRFFDKRQDSWSLYSLAVDEATVDKIKQKANELIKLRHKRVAHFAHEYENGSSFLFLSDIGINLAKEIIGEIHTQLSNIGREYYDGHIWALDWIGIDTSLDLLLEHLKSINRTN